MLIIWLEFPEISLEFGQSIQKLFDFNQVKIVMIKAVSYKNTAFKYKFINITINNTGNNEKKLNKALTEFLNEL